MDGSQIDHDEMIEEYLAKAAETKARAQQLREPHLRATLFDIASDYEHLAASIAAIRRSQEALKRVSIER